MDDALKKRLLHWCDRMDASQDAAWNGIQAILADDGVDPVQALAWIFGEASTYDWIRARAGLALLARHPELAWAVLERLVRSESPDDRSTAFDVLERSGGPRSPQLVRLLLHDPYPYIRLQAVEFLAARYPDEATAAAAELLADEQPWVRREAERLVSTVPGATRGRGNAARGTAPGMEFYHLTHPDYETDQKATAANPIRMVAELYVPAVDCPSCREETGGGWASSDRVRVPVPEASPMRAYLTRKRVPASEWAGFEQRLRQELAIPAWMRVTPGAQIGLPRGMLLSARIPDLMPPFPGQIIARREVVDALEEGGLKGLYPVPVELTWRRPDRHPGAQLPELYELVVRGAAWRVGVDAEKIIACPVCGREVMAGVCHFRIDEGRWDGSDFFCVDHNPNIVLVTERARVLLEARGFRNFACVPIG